MSEEEEVKLIGDKLMFYQSYIDEINQPPPELDDQIKTNMKETAFRSHIQSKRVDARLVREISPYVRHMINKPQELIYDNTDHYVACDLLTNTYYVCYKNLLMIDVDHYKGVESKIEDILPHCSCQIDGVMEQWRPPEEEDTTRPREATWSQYKCKNPDGCPGRYRYRVYKSRNGYHAFLVSHSMDYNDNKALQLMCEAMTDYFYMIFTYLRGWCVRVNRKTTEESIEYPYYGDVVDGKIVPIEAEYPLVDERLSKLVNLHLNLLSVFRDAGPVISFNTQ